MDDFKEDLRITRTRKLLSNALFELLETTSFEKISVIDICDKALVHRATFYNHFENKEQLLEYAIDEIKEYLFSVSVENEKFASTKEMYMTLISKVIDFVEENKAKMLCILHSNGVDKATDLMLTTIKRSLRYLTSKNEYKENYSLPRNILIDFFTGGITNIGLNWLQASNPCSKQELLNYFDILLNEKVYLK